MATLEQRIDTWLDQPYTPRIRSVNIHNVMEGEENQIQVDQDSLLRQPRPIQIWVNKRCPSTNQFMIIQTIFTGCMFTLIFTLMAYGSDVSLILLFFWVTCMALFTIWFLVIVKIRELPYLPRADGGSSLVMVEIDSTVGHHQDNHLVEGEV